MIKKATVNSEWHAAHRLPKNADAEQRLAWHLEHSKNCRCRVGIPAGLKEELKKRHHKFPLI